MASLLSCCFSGQDGERSSVSASTAAQQVQGPATLGPRQQPDVGAALSSQQLTDSTGKAGTNQTISSPRNDLRWVSALGAWKVT